MSIEETLTNLNFLAKTFFLYGAMEWKKNRNFSTFRASSAFSPFATSLNRVTGTDLAVGGV